MNLASEVTNRHGLSAVVSNELMNTSRLTGDHMDLQDSCSSLDELMILHMVINCCIVMVVLVTLYGVNTDLSLFNVWASTIHCLVVPLTENILICCVLSFNICLWAPTILNE